MKILITNVYCYLNKGDAGIVVAMIENIRKIVPDCSIALMSLYPEIDNGRYAKDVDVCSCPIEVDLVNHGIRKLTRNVSEIIKLRNRLKTGKLTKAEEIIKNADIVISCGGGYMQAFNAKHFIMDFIYHYAQLYTARSLKRPYYIFAQTVGPFSALSRKIVNPILNNASLVLVRESISFEYMKKYFNNKNTILTSDVAFLLESEKVAIPVDEKYINIGITMRKWGFPNCSNAKELMEKYEKSMVEFMDWLLMRDEYRVYIMPQCIGPDCDNDLLISNNIYKKLKKKSNVVLISDDLSPGQLKSLYGKMDYFVGTRMHSNIFALAKEVPCMAISYDTKTDGIMRLVNMSEYVVDINDINFDILKTTFINLKNDKESRRIIAERVEQIKKDAFSNFKQIFSRSLDV